MPIPKVIKINLNLNETNLFKNDPYDSNETFWTTDINSAFLEFSTTSDVSNSVASLVLYNPEDKSLVQRNIEVAEAPFSYMLREEEVTRYGHWYGQIVVEKDGIPLTDAVFRFHIKGSLLDSTDPSLIDIDNYNKLSSQLMTLYKQFNGYLADVHLSEEQRELAESVRESLFKDSQEARKQKFQLFEVERANIFDNSQKEKNDTFSQSQIERTEAFLQKESERDTTFEVSETIRQRNESDRQSEEEKRVLADSTRNAAFEASQLDKEAKFSSSEKEREETFTDNETRRMNNEQNRMFAEVTRHSAEGSRENTESQRVVAENLRNQNEAYREETFETYDNRITDIEEDIVVEATNQFINPEFKDGVDGWRLSGVKTNNVNGVIEVTVTNLGTFANQYLSQYFVHTLDHKYFLSIEINPKHSNRFGVYAGGSYVIPTITVPVANQWNKYSVVYKPVNTADLLIITHATDTNYEIGDNYYIKNILRIDLTETFGAGNEPSEKQMDRLLKQFPNSWFEGTVNIFLARWALNELRRLDDEKANRKQEEWFAPTLINGAVTDASFPIMFRKTSLGEIVFTGRYKPAPAGSYSMVLPTGYTPKSTMRFVTGTNSVNVNSTIQLQISGRVYLEFPTTPEWVDFSTVSYQGAD